MQIAFFGLGNMGFPIAANLVKNGHTVTSAVHKSQERASRFQALGGHIAASPAEAVQNAELIFTIVPNDQALRELLLDPAMLEAVPSGSVIIEMTSSSPQAVEDVAQAYAARGVDTLDAPVSGGVTGAENATMSMLCAGKPHVLERVRPVLSGIAGKLCYVSDRPGQGKIIKSLNNLLSAVGRAALGEAWRIAEAHGVNPDAFYEAVTASSGDSAALRATFPRIQSQDFQASFTVALMRKDLGLALALAGDMNLPISETTLEYYRMAAPYDDEDSAAVTKVHFPDHTGDAR